MGSLDRLTESRWAYAVLAGLVFLLALPGLFALPTLDRDEGRFAEASSEMLESGDFVEIRYHGELRNKKPVAIHWFQSAAVAMTGGAHQREIADFRIPSMLGAMLAAMGTFWAGTALFSRRAAFLAGVLVGSCLLLTTEANIAKTDAAQCGFLVIGMGALAHMRAGTGDKWHGVLFWVCLSFGVLLKGPIAPMVFALTIAGLFIWERRIEWARPLLYWLGLSLFCVLTIPWYVAVQIATEGEFLSEAVSVDLAPKLVEAAEGHEGPFGIHTAALPILFWPGTLLLVPGIWLAISRLTSRAPAQSLSDPGRQAASLAWHEREASAWRFLACWIVPSWLVFEIAPTKLVHYTLPMYPAFALMAGAAADQWFASNAWKQGRWLSAALFLVVALLLAVIPTPWILEAIRAEAASDYGARAEEVAGVWRTAWDATGIGLWPTILILAATGWTLYALFRKNAAGMVAGLVACAFAGGVGYRAVVMPNQSWMLATGASLSALREICALPEGTAAWNESGCEGRAPKKVRAIAFAEPSLVFELGNQIDIGQEARADIPPVTEDNRPAWLINVAEKEGADALAAIEKAAKAANRCVRRAQRFAYNYSNGDPSILLAVVVEPGRCQPADRPPPELREGPDSDEE